VVSRTPRILASESCSMGSLSQRLSIWGHGAALNVHHGRSRPGSPRIKYAQGDPKETRLAKWPRRRQLIRTETYVHRM